MRRNTSHFILLLFFPLAGFSQYCVPTYSNLCSSGDYIDNFTLNTLSNLASGCNGNPDNYILDTINTTSLNAGGLYPMTMQSGSSWDQGFGVWIDYNQDGDFGDPGEFVYASPTSSTVTFSTTIYVPCNALVGSTRLRIRCSYATTLGAGDTCSLQTYGENEDYTIDILPPLIPGPMITLSGSCLNYDSLLSGGTYFDTLLVSNTGCDTLVLTSITSSLVQFYPDTDAMSLLPGETRGIIVSFSPDTIGDFSGTLTILNNDNDTSVCLYGYGLPAPDISINPVSFTVNLGCNDSVTLPLVISNNGGSGLIWGASASVSVFDDFDPGVDLSVWSAFDGVANLNCGSVSGNAMFFDNMPTRQAATIDFNTSGGGIVSFYLKLGDGTPASCEYLDAGNEVYLQYSNDGGGAWTDLITFNSGGYSVFTLVNQTIPPAAQTYSTRFRVYQPVPDCNGCDNWAIDNFSVDAASFIALNPSTGITTPYSTDTVFVEFNSSGLLSGQYISQVIIYSNDPGSPQITVPCTLNVTGNPLVAISATCVNFDTTFQYGTATDTLVIFNTTADCGVLFVDSVVSNGTAFTVDSFPDLLNPGDTGIIIVRFSPLTISTFNNVLNIYSNASDTSVCLTGTSTSPPVISVVPDSFTVTLACNDSVVLPLEVINSGGFDLIWNATAPITVTDDFDPSISTSLWSSTNGLTNTNCGSMSGNSLWFGDNAAREATTVDLNTSAGGTINFYLEISSGVSAICEDADIGEEVYLEWSSDGGFSWNNMTTFNVDAYPVFTLVTLPVPPAAQTLSTRFRWSQPLHSGSCCDHWAIDDVQIDLNSFIGLNPVSGTTVPSDTTTVNLLFSSTGLIAGQYTSEITITSNDPLNNPLIIPCILNVIGNAQLTVLDSCLLFGSIMENTTAADMLILVNTGCDTLTGFAISSSAYFSLDSLGNDSTGGIILPGDSVYIPVIFSPDSAGNYSATVSLVSNGGNASVCLSGSAFPMPVICYNPDSFNISFSSCIDSVIIPLLICNSGGSDLSWNFISGTTVSDDFDPGIDLSVWTTTSGVVNTNCGPFSGNGLWFDDPGTRQAESVDLNTTGGGTVSFYLMLPQGASPCEAADAITESVDLEYSTNGGLNWTTVNTYINNAYPTLTFITEPIPVGAQTTATRFRWRQQSHSGSGFDNWLIDNVTINASGINPNIIPAQDSGITAAGDTTFINVLFTSAGLATGTYNLELFINSNDPLQAQVNLPVIIFVSDSLSQAVTSVNATCNSVCNGTATINVTGGGVPYTYAWTGGQTNSTAIGLCDGTYLVTVTDATGCAVINAATITEPSAIVVTTTIVNATCNGLCNGSASAGASGGIAPYGYLWNDPLSQTASTATGLCDGSYTVTVTDNTGCSKTASPSVTEPFALIVSTVTSSATCGNSNGSASATVGGGTTPYTYLWNDPPPQQTTGTATGLAAGGYMVTVTDANGCTGSAPATVSNTGGPTLVLNKTDVLCNGNSTGTATVNAAGGNPPYTYLWSTTPAQSSTTATGLSAGTYFISVSDNSGCLGTAGITITEPPALTAAISAGSINCNGGNNGSATVMVTGGTTPYTYNWSTGATQSVISNLFAGIYTVTVSDNKGCTTTNSTAITQPPLLVSSVSVTNAGCYGGNGSVNLTPSGGVVPYTFSWSNSAVTEDISSVPAGNYTVTVTDSKGCTITSSATVTQPSALNLAITTVPATCGSTNGSAQVTVTGGITPYSYLWNDPPPQQSSSGATGLAAGGYNVTVTDANTCTGVAAATVSNTGGPILTMNKFDVGCYGDSTGAAWVTASGGNPPYTYAWNTIPVQNTTNAFGLTAGTWFVSVTDNSGCLGVAGITVTEPPLLIATITTQTDILCNGQNNGTITVSATGGSGSIQYNWSISPVQTTSTATGLTAGTYSATVTDNNGCTATASGTITQPPLLFAFAAVTANVTCYGGNDGSAAVSASGGTTPYSYLWSNSETTSAIFNLSSLTYSVTVTDNNGCTVTGSGTVTEPASLILAASTLPANCGSSDGTAQVNVSGGIAPYTYLWNDPPPQQTTSTATGLSAGAYSVTVNDNNGCSSVAMASVNNIGGPVATGSQTDLLCNGDTTGAASVIASGGTPPYTYLWSNGFTASAIFNLSSSVYTVTVTGSNGCLSVTTVTIAEPQALSSGIVSTIASCGTCSDGSADLSVTGGTPPYTFSWSNSATTEDINNVLPGSYSVTVTDGNGCIMTDSTFIDFNVGAGEIEDFACHVYPNPTAGLVKIEFMLQITGKPQPEVKVFNMIGEEILNIPMDLTSGSVLKGAPYRMELDFSEVPCGMYLLHIFTDEISIQKRVAIVR